MTIKVFNLLTLAFSYKQTIEFIIIQQCFLSIKNNFQNSKPAYIYQYIIQLAGYLEFKDINNTRIHIVPNKISHGYK